MHYNLTFDFFPSQYYASGLVDRDAARSRIGGRLVPSSPVTYSHLVSQTKRIMSDLRATAEVTSVEFAQRMSLNGKMTLNAFEWTLKSANGPLGQLRMVHIEGARNEIINTWVFPNRPKDMPVFAAELIAVGNLTKVAFVDIQTPVVSELIAEDVAAVTAGLSPRFACLPCNEPPPDWATHDSLGNYTYARDVPSEQLPIVEDCYLGYLNTYLSAFATNRINVPMDNPSRNDAAIEALHDYQMHHMEHSPGNKFLSKLFGSEWTESFMEKFLFAKPRG